MGAAGSVVGVDISKPMPEVALRRPRLAPNLRVTFRLLDAQSDDLGMDVSTLLFPASA